MTSTLGRTSETVSARLWRPSRRVHALRRSVTRRALARRQRSCLSLRPARHRPSLGPRGPPPCHERHPQPVGSLASRTHRPPWWLFGARSVDDGTRRHLCACRWSRAEMTGSGRHRGRLGGHGTSPGLASPAETAGAAWSGVQAGGGSTAPRPDRATGTGRPASGRSRRGRDPRRNLGCDRARGTELTAAITSAASVNPLPQSRSPASRPDEREG